MKILNIQDKPFHELPYRSSGKGQPRFCSLPFYFAFVDKLPENVNSIIATSDLQGRDIDVNNNQLLGISVSEELITLRDLELIPEFEYIISVGDLFDKPELNKYGASGEVTNVLNAFSSISKEVICVHGNHDMVNISLLNPNITILDSNSTKLSNINISGVSGIIGREGRNQRKSQENYFKCLNNISKKKPHITLLHETPKGNKSKQIGNKDIQEYFVKKGAGLIISGHCHWENHLAELGDNQVLNTDSKVFIIREAE